MINWTLLIESLPGLLKGALVNINIAFFSLILGSILSIFLALMEESKRLILRRFSFFYSTIFRGTPMIVQIMFVFYGLPQLGIHLSPLVSVILAIGLNSAAYLSQVIRSGLKGISKMQYHSAKSLGMTTWQSYRYIIFPQCIRNILPALGNEGVTLLKDSSLASVVGVVEIVKLGAIIRGRTFEAFTVLLAVALVYLLMTTLLSLFIKTLEKRSEKPCSL
jgi:polar amino acid transport system permease protein